MDIIFRTEKLKRIGNSLKEAQKQLGVAGGKKLLQRLIFELANDPIPLLDNGSLDPERISIVKITDIEDYHGKKSKK